jgi:hypothetical protein
MCIFVAHSREAEIYGISYYGVHAPTLPLVAIGYGVGSVGLWRTATYLSSLDVPKIFAPGLRVVAVALPLLLITPFNHGAFFNWAHMTVGIVIGVTQMAISTYLLFRQRKFPTTVAFLLQLTGGIVAAVSLPDWGFNHMLDGEMAFELGFAWCLILWTLVAPAKMRRMADSSLSFDDE